MVESNILVATGDPQELRTIFASYGEIQDTFEKHSAAGIRLFVQFLERGDAVAA